MNNPLRMFADALAGMMSPRDKSNTHRLKAAWTALMFEQHGSHPAQDEHRVAGFEDALVSAVNADKPEALDMLAACLRSNGGVVDAISKLVTVDCPVDVPKRVCESLLRAVSAAQLAWRMKRGAGSKSEFVNQVTRTLEDWGLVSPDLSISLSSDLDVNRLVRAFSDSVAEIKEIGLLLNVLSRLLGSGIDSDPLRVLRRTVFVPAIYVSQDPSTHAMRGRVISLKLSLIERGSGLIVSDPLTEGSRRFIRDDFIQALDDAKAAACHVFCKEWPKDCDLVWSLVNVDEQDRILEGNSIGLAGAIGMLHLLHETDPDQQVLCTGGVAPDGKLSPVGGINTKTSAAAMHIHAGRFRRWIVPEEHAATATNIAVALGLTGDQTESATTLRDAYDKATDLMGAVNAYLNELVTSVEKDANKFLPDRLQHRGFWEIRQRVNVVTDRKDLRRFREELERRRASGDAINYHAYLPHRPRGELGEADDGQDREMPKAPESLDWDAQVADSSRFTKMVLLGDPGYGKSRLLQHEARRLANAVVQQLKKLPDQEGHATLSTIAVPILLRLPALAKQLPLSAGAANTQPSNPLSLSKAIVDCVVAEFCATWNRKGTSPLAVWLNQVLGEQRCVLLLDGWDEVPHALRSSLNDALNAFTSTFKGRVILSSRIVGYDYEPPNEWPELELQDFGPRQIRDFAVAWWPEKSDSTCQSAFLTQVNSSRSPTVAGLARIPLMLTLLSRLFDERWTESGQAALPSRRTELYEACLKRLLRDWRKERSGKTVADREYVPTVRKLRTIALGLQLAGKQQFSFESVSNAAGVNSQDEERTTKIATDCEDWEDAGLLTWVVADEYVWLHRTFGEYLAARALSAHIEELGWDAKLNVGGVSENVQAVLDRKAWDPDWHHVMLLLAGLVPEKHLNDLLDIVEKPKFDPALDAKAEFVAQLDQLPVWMICEQDDFFCQRLALTAQCSAEPGIVKSLKSRIVALRERCLERFRSRFACHRDAAPDLYRGLVATSRIIATTNPGEFFDTLTLKEEWEQSLLADVGIASPNERMDAVIVERITSPSWWTNSPALARVLRDWSHLSETLARQKLNRIPQEASWWGRKELYVLHVTREVFQGITLPVLSRWAASTDSEESNLAAEVTLNLVRQKPELAEQEEVAALLESLALTGTRPMSVSPVSANAVPALWGVPARTLLSMLALQHVRDSNEVGLAAFEAIQTVLRAVPGAADESVCALLDQFAMHSMTELALNQLFALLPHVRKSADRLVRVLTPHLESGCAEQQRRIAEILARSAEADPRAAERTASALHDWWNRNRSARTVDFVISLSHVAAFASAEAQRDMLAQARRVAKGEVPCDARLRTLFVDAIQRVAVAAPMLADQSADLLVKLSSDDDREMAAQAIRGLAAVVAVAPSNGRRAAHELTKQLQQRWCEGTWRAIFESLGTIAVAVPEVAEEVSNILCKSLRIEDQYVQEITHSLLSIAVRAAGQARRRIVRAVMIGIKSVDWSSPIPMEPLFEAGLRELVYDLIKAVVSMPEVLDEFLEWCDNWGDELGSLGGGQLRDLVAGCLRVIRPSLARESAARIRAALLKWAVMEPRSGYVYEHISALRALSREHLLFVGGNGRAVTYRIKSDE